MSAECFDIRARQDHIRSAVQKVWTFLEEHLALANTHGAEFISYGHWNKFVPQKAQEQLLALNHDQLVNLPHSWEDLNTVSDVSTFTNDNSGKDSAADSSGDPSDRWLQAFIGDAHKCHLGSLDVLGSLSDVVTRNDNIRLTDDEKKQYDPDVISEAMSVKKVHEVGIMSEAVADLFRSCNADIIIDVGSGKGYLSCELARHHSIPVLGLDSSDINTHGALRRDKKLGERWKGLAKKKEKKKQHKADIPIISSETFCADPALGAGKEKAVLEHCSVGNCLDIKESHSFSTENASQHESRSLPSLSDKNSELRKDNEVLFSQNMQQGSTIANETMDNLNPWLQCDCEAKNVKCDGTGIITDRNETAGAVQNYCKKQVLNITCADRTCVDSNKSYRTEANQKDSIVKGIHNLSQTFPKDNHGKFETNTASEDSIPISYSSLSAEKLMTHSLEYRTNVETSNRESFQMYVPVTMFVHPEMNLRHIIKHHAGHLYGKKDPASADLFLTGLHTCGSLAVTVMKLFLQDPGVVGLCYVGCCYQLMEESPTGEESTEPNIHFPLSKFGKEVHLHLGRNARNLASQSVHRIQASGQLQGGDFYWRALLDVLIRELGVPVPERILGMRGLNKRSKTFQEYAVSALKKLNLSADLLTQEHLKGTEEKHYDAQAQMSAFFQLKLILSPVIESLILLDRYLFLLEQECVESAHLVQLFDPVTSPRCYAIVARKSKQRD